MRSTLLQTLGLDPTQDIRITRIAVDKVIDQEKSGQIVICKSIIKVNSEKRVDAAAGEAAKYQALPVCYLVVFLPLALIGRHWYVCRLEWDGFMAKDLEAPESELTAVRYCADDAVSPA